MKSISSIVICLFISIFSFGQNHDKRITDKHINIQGTNLYIIPPDGYVSAFGVVGLQDTHSDAIIIIKKTNKSNLEGSDLNAKKVKLNSETASFFQRKINNIDYYCWEVSLNTGEYFLMEAHTQKNNSDEFLKLAKKSIDTIVIVK